jgi:hypothetical protein
VAAPLIFGKLIQVSVTAIAYGYAGAAALMLIAAAVEAWLGIDAEGKSLEEIAEPLSS